MEKIHGNTCFCAFTLKILHESTKHACFHVFLHLELTFIPHYIITDKRLLPTCSFNIKGLMKVDHIWHARSELDIDGWFLKARHMLEQSIIKSCAL